MDALEEQLAQLKLLNSRPLTPRSNPNTAGDLPSNFLGLQKKVGPAVPPKPSKKNPSAAGDYPSSHESADLEDFPGAPRKHHIYSNMKMTLDNSIILDQQLEALEYHKKQLEKRSAGSTMSGGSGSSRTNEQVDLETSDHPYLNLQLQQNPDSVVYSNIRHQSHESQIVDPEQKVVLNDHENQIVYSNVGFDDLPPPPPLDISPATGTVGPIQLPLDPINLDYLQQQQKQHNVTSGGEEDLPPPPSPVSSSYSELRRATDNFPQMPQYSVYSKTSSTNEISNPITINSHQSKSSSQYLPGSLVVVNSRVLANTSGVVGDGRQEIDSEKSSRIYQQQQQTYVNTPYQNIYNPYDPSSQMLSSSPTSDYYGYGELSQSSSTYESIYEPINPRPPSQLSSRSNYSLYTSYMNGSQATTGGSNTPPLVGNQIKSASTAGSNGVTIGIGGSNNCNSGAGGGVVNRQEAEVDALTNLLVNSMDGDSDIDSYGICVKCGDRIVGESSGCTAMEQIYHIDCFTCSQCQINLQGKPFYAVDGQPYCEFDYLNTLEKCSVCMKPILERILRATGKPYHPGCFCCVCCGKSLDGIPFTVDATNQNYCIEDFHKKFAPRCCVCHQPIMPEPGQEETVRVVALDRSFHFECYKCEDCGLLLSSEAEGRGCYPLDDHVLCKSCNAKRVQALTSRMTTEL